MTPGCPDSAYPTGDSSGGGTLVFLMAENGSSGNELNPPGCSLSQPRTGASQWAFCWGRKVLTGGKGRKPGPLSLLS